MSDKIKLWRNIANHGRGSEMTKALHEACDALDRYTRRSESGECLADVYDLQDELERVMRVVEAVRKWRLANWSGGFELEKAIDDFEAGK